jgi:hypothetical protein
MGVVTASSNHSGQGIITAYKIAAVSDADTFEGPISPKAFWVFASSNATTQASAGMNATESSGTYTFYPGEDAVSCTLFVIN